MPVECLLASYKEILYVGAGSLVMVLRPLELHERWDAMVGIVQRHFGQPLYTLVANCIAENLRRNYSIVHDSVWHGICLGFPRVYIDISYNPGLLHSMLC